ncbi:MAG: phosphate ABC transporter ATP-binding protein PstB [Myxococcota bacterium]
MTTNKLEVEGLSAGYERVDVLNGVSMAVPANQVTAVIGPSGCGKSTFIRCLNRMHELVPGARVSGRVTLDHEDIYSDSSDPVQLRRRVGMVFQKPNPFPTMSVQENVVAGLRFRDPPGTSGEESIVEQALRRAALWDEVKDRLGRRAVELSEGQQQRLCIARCLAVDPEVLLMDEPCSALDPIATARVEDLIHTLREDFTVIIVTHNMQQAARISQRTAFFLGGELVEWAATSELFTSPGDQRTEDYITGKFD